VEVFIEIIAGAVERELLKIRLIDPDFVETSIQEMAAIFEYSGYIGRADSFRAKLDS